MFTLKGEGLGTLIEFSESLTRRLLRRDGAAAVRGPAVPGAGRRDAGRARPAPRGRYLLHNALARLDQPDAPVAAVLAYFLWRRLLRNIGLLGQMGRCVACGRAPRAGDEPVYFTSLQGGLVARLCALHAPEKVRIGRVVHEGLEVLAAAEARRCTPLPDEAARTVGRLLVYHLVQQLGRPLKAARYVFGDVGAPPDQMS